MTAERDLKAVVRDDGRDRVVLVGHRWAEADRLSALARRALPGSVVARANTEDELADELRTARVCLVALTLFGKFPDSDGAELVERCRTSREFAASTEGVTMLILAYDDVESKAPSYADSLDAADEAMLAEALQEAFG